MKVFDHGNILYYGVTSPALKKNLNNTKRRRLEKHDFDYILITKRHFSN